MIKCVIIRAGVKHSVNSSPQRFRADGWRKNNDSLLLAKGLKVSGYGRISGDKAATPLFGCAYPTIRDID